MAQGKARDARKERQWRRWIRAWRTSGLSVKTFCARHALAQPRFYFWRRELERRDASAATFMPVHVVAEPSPCPDNALEITLAGGRTVRVPPGFDAATLRQLLAVLEETPC
jgi:transposase